MEIIPCVGVSGTGKTTLAEMLAVELGDDIVELVPEATKGDICTFCNLPILDFSKASQKQLYEYDFGRVVYQLQLEQESMIRAERSGKQIVIFDKALPVSLMYLFTHSARRLGSSGIDSSVFEDILIHWKKYTLLVYFPYSGVDVKLFNRAGGLNRNFSDSRILRLMDCSLREVISWFPVSPKYHAVSGGDIIKMVAELRERISYAIPD